jgi:hypothetical protein
MFLEMISARSDVFPNVEIITRLTRFFIAASSRCSFGITFEFYKKLLVMESDRNLQFIRDKIFKLRHAIMYVSGHGLVKLEKNVVTADWISNEGQLWFVTNKPLLPVDEYEQSFPARLCFYRKGYDFSMEVSGKAVIADDDYSAASGKNNTGKILVRLDMVNIEYSEPNAKREKNKVELVLEHWYDWFLRTVSIPHDSGSILKKLHQTQ